VPGHWSIGQLAVELIDQLPMAMVVINCPPLRGQLITMPSYRCYSPIHQSRRPFT
jgi:hypothetical protein